MFYDPLAQPEQVDFEGINGIVNLRQAQLRYFPASRLTPSTTARYPISSRACGANGLAGGHCDRPVGAELLHGKRTNKDDSDGDAIQMQIAAKYRF